MQTNHPRWRYLGNLGDSNPVDYGGYFIYRDATGVYSPEAEYLISPEDNGTLGWTIYRFSLDQLKAVVVADETDDTTRTFHCMPFKYAADWPHAACQYPEWFNDSLQSVADCMGYSPVEGLRAQFYSDDIMARAQAYRAIGEYHGFENLDSYPLEFATRSEVSRHYQNELRKRTGKV